MALSRDEERLLSQLHKNLRQDALEPGHAFWVDLRELRFAGAAGPDVVRQLARDVSWVEPPSVAFFSGFRGAGKSTELNRLRIALREQGFAVAKFDVEDFLDVRFPVTAGQLVFAMAPGIWRSCREQGWVGPDGDETRSPARRLWDWVRSVDMGADVKVRPPGVPAEVELHLRRDPTFRRQLDEFLRPRSVELNERANEYLTDLNTRVREHFLSQGLEWRGMVVIVDSLDHARSETAFRDVRNALREVFDLQLPLVRFEPFRTDQEGSHPAEGVDALVEMVTRRLPGGLDRDRLVSDADLERLVCCSGGHIRDLLRWWTR